MEFSRHINNLLDLTRMFPDEQSCIDYLERLRWIENPVSPFDADSKVYKCANGKYRCKNTGKYFNVLKGTMFEATKIDLQKWFLAIWLVTVHNKGITAVDLAKDIDVSYKTALFLLHRIRANFWIENYNQLKGIVEADETLYGGKNKNRHKDKKFPYRKTNGNTKISFEDKSMIVGVIERGGKMNAFVVGDRSKKNLHGILKKYVEKGSMLMTDDWAGYKGLTRLFSHKYVKHAGKQYVDMDNRETHTNNVECRWKALKNCIRDMYCNVSDKYLQLYVDEFIYRTNMAKFSASDRFNWILVNSGTKVTFNNLRNGEIYG